MPARVTHLVTNGHDGVPAYVMLGLPNLEMISSKGVGYDAKDVEAAKARGVVVTQTRNVLKAEVATTAVMLMMGLLSRTIKR